MNTVKSSSDPLPLYTLRGHTQAVSCLRFFDERFLISGAADGNLRIWDLIETKRTVLSTSAHSAQILSVNRVDDRSFESSGRDGVIRIWDLEYAATPTEFKPIMEFYSGCMHFCGSHTAPEILPSTIISGSAEQSDMLVWDMRQSTASPAIHLHNTIASQQAGRSQEPGMLTSITSLPHSVDTPGSMIIFGGYEDGSVRGYDIRSPSRELCMLPVLNGPVLTIACSRRKQMVYAAGADTMIEAIRFNSNTLQQQNNVSFQIEGTASVAVRLDERILLSAHWDGSMRLFDTKRLKPLAILRHHRDGVASVDFIMKQTSNISTNDIESTNEDVFGLFASGSKDHTIAVWDLFATSYRHH